MTGPVAVTLSLTESAGPGGTRDFDVTLTVGDQMRGVTLRSPAGETEGELLARFGAGLGTFAHMVQFSANSIIDLERGVATSAPSPDFSSTGVMPATPMEGTTS